MTPTFMTGHLEVQDQFVRIAYQGECRPLPPQSAPHSASVLDDLAILAKLQNVWRGSRSDLQSVPASNAFPGYRRVDLLPQTWTVTETSISSWDDRLEWYAHRLVGDSNGDGIFDSSDLVRLFQAGEFEDDINGNSTFREGDWNRDGDFDSSDLVLAFRAGHYSATAACVIAITIHRRLGDP